MESPRILHPVGWWDLYISEAGIGECDVITVLHGPVAFEMNPFQQVRGFHVRTANFDFQKHDYYNDRIIVSESHALSLMVKSPILLCVIDVRRRDIKNAE